MPRAPLVCPGTLKHRLTHLLLLLLAVLLLLVLLLSILQLLPLLPFLQPFVDLLVNRAAVSVVFQSHLQSTWDSPCSATQTVRIGVNRSVLHRVVWVLLSLQECCHCTPSTLPPFQPPCQLHACLTSAMLEQVVWYGWLQRTQECTGTLAGECILPTMQLVYCCSCCDCYWYCWTGHNNLPHPFSQLVTALQARFQACAAASQAGRLAGWHIAQHML